MSRLMAALMLGLLVWGLWIAAGAWRHNRGHLKTLIIASFVLLFLGFWFALLKQRERRSKSEG